jgi:hypothetical protein
VKLAYADPPYPGCARKYYRDHPDFDGEVDHGELITRLERNFDGWALSTSAKALSTVLVLCASDVRVLAWTKPMHNIFPGVRVQYAWEPVIVRPARTAGRPGTAQVADHLHLSPDCYQWRTPTPGHVTGAKPRAFCLWIFDCLGAEPGDELDDLFPGSGVVGEAWAQFIAQPRLEPYPRSKRAKPLTEAMGI